MQDDDDRSDSFEEDLEGDKYLEDPNLSIAGSPRDDGNTAVLAFKILIATPLLAVSKATNEEMTKVLTTTKRYYERLLLSSIYLHRITSPSAALIDLWASCEFFLRHDYGKSIFFLRDLPDSLKSCVRRLVLPCDFLSLIAYSRWTKEQSRGGALFTNWISENFPNLRTVAIEVPDVCEVMEMNWNEASDYLCEMLKNGRLDTVRFYYKDYEKGECARRETDSLFFRHITLEGCDYEGTEEEDRSLLTGVEEPISPTSLASQLWRDLRACRVVKITRSQATA